MVRLENVNKYYQSGSEKIHAIKDLNITFPDKGLVFILGPSGCGKSTLLNLICGFIENEYVNLSPKRQGAGEAYLEMYFDESVRKFDINLSYWQSLDKLSSLDSTAYLEVLNSESKWVRATDLINDVNLSTDRTHQETYYYNYVGNEIWGIRIIMTSPATGSRNLGRISLGNLTMIHTI